MKALCIVIPVYNEELAVEYGCKELLKVLSHLIEKNKISPSSYLLFVNDGSTDNTQNILEKLAQDDKNISIISLASNTGHQNALFAGLLNQEADMCISIDVDLQDDISKIEEMVDLYSQGYHIVYGV